MGPKTSNAKRCSTDFTNDDGGQQLVFPREKQSKYHIVNYILVQYPMGFTAEWNRQGAQCWPVLVAAAGKSISSP